MTASFDLDQPLRLHPLTFLDEGEEVTVGRADINSYGMFPADGAALIRQLAAGSSPNDAARWYTEQFGEQVDMAEFVELLAEFDLLVADGEEVTEVGTVRWQRLGRALFSPVAWCCYAILVGAGVVAMVRQPALVPNYRYLFFTNSLVVLTVVLFLGQMPWILLHESFHALAGRRLGLPSRLSIGRRLYFVVFETSLDGLVSVPRRKRYLPMLAGMVMDLLVIAGLTLGAAALLPVGGGAALVGRIFLAMAFATVLRLSWQFYFFLRTDLYYLATTVLGCVDLHTVAKQMLGNRINRLLGRHGRLVDESLWHPRDRQVGRWYSWLMLVGYLVMSVLLISQIVPVLIKIIHIIIVKISVTHSLLNLGDVTLFIILNFGELVVAGILALRGYRRRVRTSMALADNGASQ
jgi:hypothetical protein